MPAKVRLTLLAVVLAAAGWFVVKISTGEVGDVPDPSASAGGISAGGISVGGTSDSTSRRVFTSSAQCAECHPSIYDEWKSSFHGQAWTDEEYQLLRTKENSQDCIPCHAPKPAYLTGFGNRFLARYDRRGEGVDCFTCHQTEEGMIGPTPELQPAPCNPVFDLRIRNMDLCYPCHNQHDTHLEWKASPFFQEGKDCNSCHMPPVERTVAGGGKKMGSSHEFLGGHAFDYVRTAIEFDVKALADDEAPGSVFQGPFGVDEPGSFLVGLTRDEGQPRTSGGGSRFQVCVKNSGAGHNLPTDSRNNTIDLKLVVYNEEGVEKRRYFVDRFRNPYREEYKKNKTNTQIPSGAERVYVVEVPDRKGAVEAVLIYKSGPFLPDDDENSEVLFAKRLLLR